MNRSLDIWDVTRDHHDTRVHTLSTGHPWGPVFYATLPRDTDTAPGPGTNGGGLRHRLVSILWEHLVKMERSVGNCDLFSTRVTPRIQVVQDALGKPHLLVGEDRGPAISFSEGGGAVWAALCGDQSEIGIDLAAPDEFQGDYPVHRVFQAQEFQHAVRLTAGNVEQASALLWSVKEAIVKALGCGFHLVEPRDICVLPSLEEDGQYAFEVCLSSKALTRLPISAGRSIWVRAIPQAGMWLSIAFLNGPLRHGDGRECRHVLAHGKVDL